MQIVDIVAQNSKCIRNKVGAILVKNDNIIGIGYNGTPYGMCNDCEDYLGNTKPDVVHAELNAILKCAADGIACKGATLYCSLSPCMECAKAIIQAKIIRVVYGTKYRISDGIEFLTKSVDVSECEYRVQGDI
jgi:dCMP deaminase